MNTPLYPLPSSAFLHKGILIDGSLVLEHSDDRHSTGGIVSGNDQPMASSPTASEEQHSDEIQSESMIKREYSLRHRASLLHKFVGNDCLPVEVSFWNLKMEVPDASVRVRPCTSPSRKTILNSVTGVFEPG
eukprot:230812-Hanusia_phi.AAC.1